MDYAEMVTHLSNEDLAANNKEIANLPRKHGFKTGEELKSEGK